MENVIVMPAIVPFFYCGQKVFTSIQLVAAYGCKASRIKDNFYNHKNAFVEGVDYFKLVGEDVNEFKKQNEAGRFPATTTEASRFPATSFISARTTKLILWTQSGAFKHSQFINTPYAKAVFEKLSQIFFQNFVAKSSIPPANNQPRLPKIRKPKNKTVDDAEFEKLLKLIDRTNDERLREQLIKRAAGINELPKCVYILLLENELVKIGITQDFQRRAREIITATGFNVKNWCHTNYLPPEIARDIEINLQEIFQDFQADGEFFKIEFDNAVEKLAEVEEIIDFQSIQ